MVLPIGFAVTRIASAVGGSYWVAEDTSTSGTILMSQVHADPDNSQFLLRLHQNQKQEIYALDIDDPSTLNWKRELYSAYSTKVHYNPIAINSDISKASFGVQRVGGVSYCCAVGSVSHSNTQYNPNLPTLFYMNLSNGNIHQRYSFSHPSTTPYQYGNGRAILTSHALGANSGNTGSMRGLYSWLGLNGVAGQWHNGSINATATSSDQFQYYDDNRTYQIRIMGGINSKSYSSSYNIITASMSGSNYAFTDSYGHASIINGTTNSGSTNMSLDNIASKSCHYIYNGATHMFTATTNVGQGGRRAVQVQTNENNKLLYANAPSTNSWGNQSRYFEKASSYSTQDLFCGGLISDSGDNYCFVAMSSLSTNDVTIVRLDRTDFSNYTALNISNANFPTLPKAAAAYNQDFSGIDMDLYDDDTLILSMTRDNNSVFAIKIPSDLSVSGTYGSFTFSQGLPSHIATGSNASIYTGSFVWRQGNDLKSNNTYTFNGTTTLDKRTSDNTWMTSRTSGALYNASLTKTDI